MCPNFAQLKAASEVWLELRHTVEEAAADLSSHEVLAAYHPAPDHAADENKPCAVADPNSILGL